MSSTIVEKQNEILLNYILSPDILNNNLNLTVLHSEINANNLYNISKCPASTTLTAKRDDFSNRIIDFDESKINDVGANTKNSMSFNRTPGAIDESVRGSAMNFPFWPGGFKEPVCELESLDLDDIDFEDKYRCTVPPGFTHGVSFEVEQTSESEENVNLIKSLDSMVSNEWFQINQELSPTSSVSEELIESNDKSIDNLLLKTTDKNNVLVISETPTKNDSKWSEMVDISQPVLDFKEKIPEPARVFPFELDNFQKQAIIKLEEQKYVFVAAHTSAGKTVIAEYAIALSENHMTKTIYTSPIKALSNQKYRDFKNIFKSVGLITGDLQIDSDASCLIMTTEILRSMLFCGSDITRDLEYVIFDEVHYINDEDRGHVWEEVIMLLPSRVNIIMLSATVPNTQELANWVGSIKKRKVYVISTLKRPVPLVHYLFTGCSKKVHKDIFQIVNAEKEFNISNYKEASNTFLKTFKSDKTRWSNLIDYLKQEEKLPVVAFTLSRLRCDDNVKALELINLNTEPERKLVKSFFKNCLQPLKPADRVLKQVLTLQSSLERGIGVHHSGILPILKEIVELLFQQNLIKVLFATETFAMGVNMPARTVIFDSHIKYDGFGLRILKAGEYTQMAGRAGRRGHDENGTVIISIRKEMPKEHELKLMMLGQPERLESKFLLRYAVILTCSRIENLTIKDLMEHNFKQFKNYKPQNKKLIKDAECVLLKLEENEYNEKFSEFYDIAFNYLNNRKEIMKIWLEQQKNTKKLIPGKILLITNGSHYNKLGILLSIKFHNEKETELKVLVLDHQNNFHKKTELSEDKCELWHKMLSLVPKNKFFYPEGVGGHSVIDIKLSEIISLPEFKISKLDCNIIINDWNKRQMERFADASPAPTVLNAVTELTIINKTYQTSLPKKNVHMEKIQIENLEAYKKFSKSEEKLNEVLKFLDISNFEDEFQKVFLKKKLQSKISFLQFENSLENSSLYPDLKGKINVLKQLKYLDENDEVTLKGKIACGMGKNELFITELILCNIFNNLNSAEIAALLSGLVFEAQTNIKAKTPNEKIKKCMEEFEKINETITDAEQANTVKPETKLNFGLVEVVYEWARNKAFVEITKLTDIQEGIIVRCIQQLDETIQDVKTAAMMIGNPALQSKMEAASTAIKRDIVFTQSLYTANII